MASVVEESDGVPPASAARSRELDKGANRDVAQKDEQDLCAVRGFALMDVREREAILRDAAGPAGTETLPGVSEEGPAS
jgi:hypothetical protein